MVKKKKSSGTLPSRDEILAFVKSSPTPVGKREIARAFNIKGSDRIPLKHLLKELREEGLIDSGRKRKVRPKGTLPDVGVIHITGIDEDGELIGAPAVWHEETPPPPIFVAPDRKGRPTLAEGDRILARLTRQADGSYEASPIRLIGPAPKQIVGVLSLDPAGARLQSTDRRHKQDFIVDSQDTLNAASGDLVLAEMSPGRYRGQPRARVTEVVGPMGDPRTVSLIAIKTHDIPEEFSNAALEEARAAQPVHEPGRRTDLRDIPLVTIDGADARDFDDAVWAEPDPDPDNAGGFHLIVAIADVANYVRAGSALDKAAFARGNSVYFPDRVVPMLPFELSADLCSLKPGESRACLAAHLWISETGQLRRHKFERGLMRSAARLTYEQVQAAQDGQPDDLTGPLEAEILTPLYSAYRALARARAKRGTLDLDLPERTVRLGEDGRIERIEIRARLDSHRLIEEFMIAANIAAAETLEGRHWPCMYRVHAPPDPVKVESLTEVLDGMGYHLDPNRLTRPRAFAEVLDKVSGDPNETLINELILRTQSQAVYTPENQGHFGLALARYCHFTSPIRRYADLLVHRALISALRLGEDGIDPADGGKFEDWGEQISGTERRAQAAERDAMDRYLAAFLSGRVGDVFDSRITGVTRFGLFVRLVKEGAEGLVPVRALGDEYFFHDEKRHALIGQQTDTVYVLGDQVKVRLREADGVTGGLILDLLTEARARPRSIPAPDSPRSGGRLTSHRRPPHRGRSKSGPSGKQPGPRGKPGKRRPRR
ncbi:MAG: ribonuclease R [Alphaproteobacteria bacterium]